MSRIIAPQWVNRRRRGEGRPRSEARRLSRKLLPTSVDGLFGWFRASELSDAYSDTDAVSVWPNESSNLRSAVNLTTNQRPLFKTNIINGQPTVHFPSGDTTDKLTTATFSSVSQPLTVLGCIRPESGEGSGIFDTTNSGSRVVLFMTGTNDVDLAYFAGSSVTIKTLSKPETVIFTVVFDSPNSFARVNGTLETSGDDVGSNSMSDIRIGNNQAGDNSLVGHIAELMFYDSRLTDVQIDALERYLNGKYGVF